MAGGEEGTAAEELVVEVRGRGMLALFVDAAVPVSDAAVEDVMKLLFEMVASAETSFAAAAAAAEEQAAAAVVPHDCVVAVVVADEK